MTSALRARDEFSEGARQCEHGHAATGHHGIVEAPEVETRAERNLGLGAQAIDLAVAHLVSAGLPGPGAVAVHFTADLLHARTIGTGEPVDGLLARPALGMQAGVDHQPAGAE
jgi:hypothetical protein